ncbi:MAG: hypothetical protein LBO72_00645 [Helicobacteraceae bacterium]|jgi:hypothetical protein|nr:hypothetical protein [Helicobacteraceae bacterium]
MHVKRYVLFSGLLIVALGIFIYINDSSDYAAHIGEESYTLPIAVWAMLPALIVFLVSFSHVAFYATAALFAKSALEKDFKTLKKLVINALLGQTNALSLKRPELAAIGRLLSDSQLKPRSNAEKTGDNELDAILDVLAKLEKGEIADLGDLKLVKNSPVWVAFQLIKMKSDPKVSEELLSASETGSEVYYKALETYATYGEKKRFLRADTKINARTALNLLARYRAPIQSMEFETGEIIDLISKASFTEKEFVALARIMKERVSPEALLELFAQLKNVFESAQSAWLYINIELERQDDAKEILDSSASDEYLAFKSYFALKEAGLSPNLDSLIDRAI